MQPKNAALLVLVVTLTSVAAAQAPESRVKKVRADPCVAGHQEGVAALKQGLADLAGWCALKKLERERARVLELFLVFDPDDADARKALGYVTAKGGGWDRPKSWTAPTNRDDESLGDFKKKRAEVGGVFLDAMAKLLEENRRDVEPAMRARILGDMNAVDANDLRTRRAGGEEQAGNKWVLAETVRGPARRKQLEKWAKQAVSAAGTPEPTEPMGNDSTMDIKWTAIVATEHFRVMGTGTKDEIMKAAILCQAAGQFFGKALETEDPTTTAYRTPIYLCADPNAKANFLRYMVKPEQRENIAKLGGTGVDGGIATWAADAPGRIDLVLRNLFGGYVGRSFGIEGNQNGALYEGIGIHLTWFLTNTRLTWTIGKRKYAQGGPDPIEDKLRKNDSDWFGMAYDQWAGKNRPQLRPLFAKHLNDLDAEDMVASYGFAVWLIEGRSDDASRFLRRAGRNQTDDGCKQAFGLELNEVEDRLQRWAKEARK